MWQFPLLIHLNAKAIQSCIRERHIVKHGVEWSGFVKGGFVKHGFVKGGFVKGGFVKGGFVKGGFVKGGFVKHGFVKHGFVKGGFVKHGFVKHGFVKGGFVKHDNLKLKRATRKVQIFFRADQTENRAGDNCWFSRDVTKFRTSEILILQKFYFHAV